VRFKEKLKMAQYFIDTCEKIISIMLISGTMLAYLAVRYPKDTYGRRTAWITRTALTAGIILALWMAVMKNFTNRINTSIWNLWIFILVFASFLAFLLFTFLEKKWKASDGLIPSAALGLQVCLLIFYALPDVLAYPYAIYFTNKTVLSTDFILKTLGVIFGLILSYIAGLGAYKVSKALSAKTLLWVMGMMMIINEIKQIGTAGSILLVKRYISSNHFLFTYAKIVNNYSRLFIYGEIIMAAVLAVALIVKSFRVNEPYENKAQHRKIKAKWRMNRRWSAEVLICLVLVVFTLTGLETLTSQVVELSPIEDAIIKDGAVYVSFDQVSDGHLHRFGFTTDGGVTIRFIVIKKPNASSYGIGLDACDICGETGYYEKDDKVVCNLCDVVMNINTIGFKGGCNPIIIDYSISDGYIIVPIDGLLEYESEFK
jgi:uncharacterized membrane protein